VNIYVALYGADSFEPSDMLAVCTSFVKAADALEKEFESHVRDHVERLQQGEDLISEKEFRETHANNKHEVWEILVWVPDGECVDNVSGLPAIRQARAGIQREELAKFKGRTPQEFRDLFFNLNNDDRVVMMQEHYDWINNYKNDNLYLQEVFEWWKKFVTRGLTLMKEGGSDDAQQGDSDSG
jgi:hypothetical protein